MLTLALPLLLASLPCTDLRDGAQRLEALAADRPDEAAALMRELEARAGGLPLSLPEDRTPEAQAHTGATRLKEACALQDAAALQEPLPAGSRDRLQAILDRPEFAQARRRNSDFVQRLLRELEAWMDGFFQSRGAQGFAVATRAVMLGLALAVILWGLLRLRRWRRPPALAPVAAAGAASPLALDSPREHLQRARAALVPDPREAIRQGLLALLSTLEERRLARPDRVKTNRELAAELPARGAPASLVQEVERLTRWYDQAFYSLSPVPAEEAARFVDEVERLHRSPPGAPA
ncbi:DUF4129 domain-containing protein [Stigmatella erecta]|uniref:Protein-glutamine gamma-glutamyltransferase-like C-terminal domain-containing protein n=1 Tax=Stigmatella erecta TaxID=83460 RepID=A0A1I0K921_9BACT|nr:DUF4129 domain-containing protein [Stigmatella erecta]SEU20215.1 protein of unknown function [Stigmatella erecta]